jgi:hypothetical protein
VAEGVTRRPSKNNGSQKRARQKNKCYDNKNNK